MTGDNLHLPLLLLLSMALTFFLMPRFIALLQQGESGFTANNYEGKRIITAGGVVILPAVIIPLIIYTDTITYRLLLIIFLAGMVALGLVDDLLGEKTCKGFRGHFGLLWRGKKVSTGLLKAVGGFSLALLAAAGVGGIYSIEWLVRGGVLALFANLFNLLDTRPAMAVKAFYLISLAYIFFGVGELLIIFLLWVSLYVYLPWELSRKVMLGDTGAYLLGGTLGFITIFSFSSGKLYIFLIFLLLVHVLLERYSLSNLLERGAQRCELLRFYGSAIIKWRSKQ
ncbi:MAG: hypothetical protein AB1796_14150 [Bacillota bacterium]